MTNLYLEAEDQLDNPEDSPEKRAIKSFARKLHLLTLSNPKTIKGEKKGYLTAVLMLAPAYYSGFEVCPFRTPGCTRACLNTAGRGGMVKGGASSPEEVIHRSNVIQKARLRRTLLLYADTKIQTPKPKIPFQFEIMLMDEIKRLVMFSQAEGYIPAVRLNGTSDLLWEKMRLESAPNIMSAFPHVQFYDYTKHPHKNRIPIPPNYYLNYSWHEQAIASRRANEWLRIQGVNPVVVFDTKKNHPLPKTFMGFRVIDGDESDLRFKDPKNVVVGLRAKGFAKSDTTGFVVRTGFPIPNPPMPDDFEGGDLFPDLQ